MDLDAGTRVVTTLEGEGVIVETPTWADTKEGTSWVLLDSKPNRPHAYFTDGLYVI